MHFLRRTAGYTRWDHKNEDILTEFTYQYRYPSLSAVNWFQKNTALNELCIKVSVQKLESTVYYCTRTRALQ
jgi:hypothetical protein